MIVFMYLLFHLLVAPLKKSLILSYHNNY